MASYAGRHCRFFFLCAAFAAATALGLLGPLCGHSFAQPAIEAHADPGIVVGAKLGAGFGAGLNELGGSLIGELELGYLLPLPQPINHSFELFISGAYSAPGMTETIETMDARLPGDGSFSYDVRQHFFVLSAGALFRLPLPTSTFSPYAAVGWRGYMIDTKITGVSNSQALGETRELGFEHGLLISLGTDIYVGPGALLAEVQMSYAGRDAYVFRDTNYGSLALMLGYRFMFGSAAKREPDATVEEAVREPSATEQTTAAAATPEPAPAAPATDVVTAAVVAPADAGPAQGSGQIRGTVRSFAGDGVQATIAVSPIKQKITTDAAGNFSLDVPPGRYSVRVRAAKFKSQSRDVVVTENGVTVLNVELGKK